MKTKQQIKAQIQKRRDKISVLEDQITALVAEARAIKDAEIQAENERTAPLRQPYVDDQGRTLRATWLWTENPESQTAIPNWFVTLGTEKAAYAYIQRRMADGYPHHNSTKVVQPRYTGKHGISVLDKNGNEERLMLAPLFRESLLSAEVTT